MWQRQTIGPRLRWQGRTSARSLVLLLVLLCACLLPQTSGQDIKVGTFIDEETLERCKADAAQADENMDMKLSSNEYLSFLEIYSEGALDGIDEFRDIPLRLIIIYHWVACFCTFEPDPDMDCCVGEEANIPLDDATLSQETLMVFCAQTDQAIDEIFGAPTTSPSESRSPSIAPVPPTPLPTLSFAPTVGPPSPAPSIVETLSPTLEPTSTPVQDSNAPTFSPSTAPSTVETLSPTLEPTSAPVQATTAPTFSPSLAPSTVETLSPTLEPTSTPALEPTRAPVLEPVLEPTSAPVQATTAPTVSPSLAPSPVESLSPTLEPTSAPVRATTAPTFSPSLAPSTVESLSPTLEPTSTPTLEPTSAPVQATNSPTISLVPSPAPSFVPSYTPSITTQRPTDQGLMCINFQYTVRNEAGLSADEIFNEEDNTLKSRLIIATEITVTDVLNETFPLLARLVGGGLSVSSQFGSKLPDVISEKKEDLPDLSHVMSVQHGSSSEDGDSTYLELFGDGRRLFAPDRLTSAVEYASVTALGGSSNAFHDVRGELERFLHPHQQANRRRIVATMDHSRRRLVYYTYDFPVTILSITDAPLLLCNGFADTDMSRCAIVTTKVCVVLGPEDNPEVVRAAIVAGMSDAFESGEFEENIPPAPPGESKL